MNFKSTVYIEEGSDHACNMRVSPPPGTSIWIEPYATPCKDYQVRSCGQSMGYVWSMRRTVRSCLIIAKRMSSLLGLGINQSCMLLDEQVPARP